MNKNDYTYKKCKHLINFIESYMDIKLYTYQKILLCLLYYKGIKTNPHNLIMRDATKQEQESINNYIKSISKDTGVNFFDLCDSLDRKDSE